MRPDLKAVTLCIADCVTPALAARALGHSIAQCDFGDAILFTDLEVTGEHFRTVPIARLRSKNDYSRFMIKELGPHIRTPYVLVAQWDGYVVDPQQWSAEFLQYDYIGARWPQYQDGRTVGNGGFSLRSQKLLQALSDPRFKFVADAPEDDLICRLNHDLLVSAHGIRFGPESVAVKFSYEWEQPQTPSFGFHSLANFWRHVDDAEMVVLANLLTPSILKSQPCMALMLTYYSRQRLQPWYALYSRLRRLAAPAEIAFAMSHVIQVPAKAADGVTKWDDVMGRMAAGQM